MGHQRFHLELLADRLVAPPDSWPAGYALRPENRPPPDLCRLLYHDVGEAYEWMDRARWSDEQWRAHVARPENAFWVLWNGEDPAGFFELKREADGESVEIAYFGLVPAHIGRGLGSRLLTAAVLEARALGASRVWLHTCTKDHPHARRNYEARGFRLFMTEDM
jgi:GNAT superfamily N-acetyltransferase